MRRCRTVLAVGALALTLAAAGCSGGGGEAATGDTPPSSSPPVTTAPAPAATGVPTPPSGWAPAREKDLVFALPPGFTTLPQGTGMAGAAHQWAKTDDADLSIPPAVAVFVETGAVGPLAFRTDALSKVRSVDLGAQPFGPPRALAVPGSAGANVLEWRWDYDVRKDGNPVPSRQVEVLVQTDGDAQYGLLLGAPSAFLTDDVVAAFTSSIAVVPVDGAA